MHPYEHSDTLSPPRGSQEKPSTESTRKRRGGKGKKKREKKKGKELSFPEASGNGGGVCGRGRRAAKIDTRGLFRLIPERNISGWR